LANFTFCRSGTASCNTYGRGSTAACALAMFFPSFLFLFIALPCLPPLADALSSRGAFDDWAIARLSHRAISQSPNGSITESPDDFNPHGPGRAADTLHRRIN